MITLISIKPPAGARQHFKRVGRGRGSGKGKTSGRGQKGQNARTGGGVRLGFEGGQMPLSRRIPKKGFTPPFHVRWETVALSRLNQFSDHSEINREKLLERGLIHAIARPVKILGDGEITKPLIVRVQGFSKSAREKIERVGGKAEVLKP